MPVWSIAGGIRRTDGTTQVELEPFAPSLKVDRDFIHTIDALPAAQSVSVPLGAVAKAQWVAILASAPINLTLIKAGPVSMGPMRVKDLVLNDTDLIGLTVANTVGSGDTAVDVRVFIGGAKA